MGIISLILGIVTGLLICEYMKYLYKKAGWPGVINTVVCVGLGFLAGLSIAHTFFSGSV